MYNLLWMGMRMCVLENGLLWIGCEWYARNGSVNFNLWWALVIIYSIWLCVEIVNEVKYVCHDIIHLTQWFKDSFMIKRSYSLQFIIPCICRKTVSSLAAYAILCILPWDCASQYCKSFVSPIGCSEILGFEPKIL